MLSVENLSVAHKDKTVAINNINFSVGECEKIALIGENGAGKTSLLFSLVGVLENCGGSIIIDKTTLTKKTLPEVRKKIGMVFQNPDDQLFMPMVFDDIAFGLRNASFSEPEIKKMVAETLEKLNISHLQNRSSLKLSGGEKRLIAIASVLAMNPSLVLFDEPTAFLDHKARRTLIETLNKQSFSKIIATHDLEFAKETTSRVILLNKGKIIADGSSQLLYDKEIMSEGGLEAIEK